MRRMTRTEEQIVIKVIATVLLAGHRITVCDQGVVLVTNSFSTSRFGEEGLNDL